jgi:two-component system, LytTR family, response regulator
MPALRALVVDDELLARRRLTMLLADEPDVEVVAECENGEEAVAAIEAHAPNLVFLDVQMPEVDGFGVLEAVGPERMPAVIFVTAYDRYALRAFDVHAVDYLLKPFARARFEQALARARAGLLAPPPDPPAEDAHPLAALLDELRKGGRWLERLAVHEGGRVFFLRTVEIDWIESAGNYLRLHAGADQHLVRGTIKAIEGKLDPARFLRVHRGTLVNLDRVREIHPWFNGEYVLTLHDGTRLESGWGYGKRVREATRNPL